MPRVEGGITTHQNGLEVLNDRIQLRTQSRLLRGHFFRTVLYFTFLFWGVHHLDLSGVPSWPVHAGVVDAANELKIRPKTLYNHERVMFTINMTHLSTYVAPEAHHHTYDKTFRTQEGDSLS